MIEIIIAVCGIIGVILLLWYILGLRDKVKYLNQLCDSQANQLLKERRSISIERQVHEAKLYELKQSYKRAVEKFKS